MYLLFQGADEDDVSQDLAVQTTKIYTIKKETSEGLHDVGLVVDGVKVLTALGNFPRACSMLTALTYVLNLAYPKELRYTKVKAFYIVLTYLKCLDMDYLSNFFGLFLFLSDFRYTFEVFQKLLLELDCTKLSPKVNNLKNKLLA